MAALAFVLILTKVRSLSKIPQPRMSHPEQNIKPIKKRTNNEPKELLKHKSRAEKSTKN